jgi:hypothetical protein
MQCGLQSAFFRRKRAKALTAKKLDYLVYSALIRK